MVAVESYHLTKTLNGSLARSFEYAVYYPTEGSPRSIVIRSEVRTIPLARSFTLITAAYFAPKTAEISCIRIDS
jgi:hypothetical protein